MTTAHEETIYQLTDIADAAPRMAEALEEIKETLVHVACSLDCINSKV